MTSTPPHRAPHTLRLEQLHRPCRDLQLACATLSSCPSSQSIDFPPVERLYLSRARWAHSGIGMFWLSRSGNYESAPWVGSHHDPHRPGDHGRLDFFRRALHSSSPPVNVLLLVTFGPIWSW